VKRPSRQPPIGECTLRNIPTSILNVNVWWFLILNTRRKIKGHYFVSIGTMDTILVHPREVFRLAIMASASAIALMHNHPSGESTPSEADIKVTRDLIRAGQLLKIEVLDHIVIGNGNHTSLRAIGYFAY
jgi:DNA repair protein RadC